MIFFFFFLKRTCIKMELGILGVEALNMVINAKPLSFGDSPHLSPSPFSVYLSGRPPSSLF